MVFNFNLTGDARKSLVKALEDLLGEKAHYMFMPTCAYEICGLTISKAGEISCDDTELTPELNELIAALHDRGFDPIVAQAPDAAPAKAEPETAEQNVTAVDPESTSLPPITDLVISVAKDIGDAAAIDRLKNMIASKRTLLMKSLGVDDLPLEITDSEIRFPWFKGPMTSEEGNAYLQLVSAMWKLAREQKRISASEKPTDNEKYTFRCWLLRLGFIGADSKAIRKILMRNLSGSAAFRYVASANQVEETNT